MSEIRTTQVSIKDLDMEIAKKACDKMGLGTNKISEKSIGITRSKVPLYAGQIVLEKNKNGNATFKADLRNSGNRNVFEEFKNEFECNYNKIVAEDFLSGMGWETVEEEVEEDEIVIKLRTYV